MFNEMEGLLPNLAGSGYEVTAETTGEFNCIAWDLGITAQRWDCDSPASYWSPSLPRNQEVRTIMRLFADEGFRLCENDLLEPGFDKIAIYAFAGQLENGFWTSKIGNRETITHLRLADLSGGAYGSVHCIMRRPSADF